MPHASFKFLINELEPGDQHYVQSHKTSFLCGYYSPSNCEIFINLKEILRYDNLYLDIAFPSIKDKILSDYLENHIKSVINHEILHKVLDENVGYTASCAFDKLDGRNYRIASL